jgi:hypothetical protein
MMEIRKRILTLLCKKVSKAPGVGGFPDADMMTPFYEFRDDAPKKMRVAMVPAGQQRMTENSDVHGI